ncbi:hypothetical protein GGS21DRAFT_486930 [Xylaria nigripes]|nr:hypothetical protein GGS21DRAFT_486930 [Xylaria nigripes]
MSSLSSDPENAACAARSDSLPVTSIAATATSIGAGTATGEHAHSFTALTGSPPSIPDHAHPTATASPRPSESPVLPISSFLPPQLSVDASQGSHAINNRARPPLASHRPNGVSLLTKALASARGIPSPATSSEADQRQSFQNHIQTFDQISRSNQPGHASDSPPDLTSSDSRQESSPHRLDGLSIPGALHRSIDPTRARSSPSLHPSTYSAGATTNPNSTKMSTATETISVINDFRVPFVMTRARGRSLERTEKEARLQRPLNTELLSDVFEDSLCGHDDRALPDHNHLEGNADSRTECPARRTESSVPMGSEKAWSIGTGDDGPQDGQVEMSIAEVLAGMEPKRSRKASHSLRFFKEGLPTDKVKRRESKPASQREQLSPPKGLGGDAQPTLQTVLSTSPETISHPHRSIEKSQSAQLSPHTEYLSSNTSMTKTPSDRYIKGGHSNLQKDEIVTTHSGGTLDHDQAVQAVPSSSALCNRSHIESKEMKASDKPACRDSTESTSHVTNLGEVVEEGEESSEEKISSAVFLPHQSLEDSAEEEGSCVIEKVEPQRPHARASTAKEFNPWLVKANEPETEEQSLTAVHHEDIPTGKKDSMLNGRDLPKNEDHENAVQNEIEVKRKPCDKPSMTSRLSSRNYEEIVHEHQFEPNKVPLEAIELIPYKHQVGGHTTIWRFSKRAVCKQLNNRENEFYERIERYHRDLLPFLPRYIGVLNVTFQKQPRQRSMARKDELSGTDKQPGESGIQANGNAKPKVRPSSDGFDESRRRIVSQSLQQSGHIPVPTVTFVDNQHILPRSLLLPSVVSGIKERPRSASAATVQHRVSDMLSQSPSQCAVRNTRPILEDRHANSWGATTINKRLRNEVFNDAFLNQPFAVYKHQRPASYHRSVPRRAVQPYPASPSKAIPIIEGDYKKSSLSNELNNTKTQATLRLKQGGLEPRGDMLTVNDADDIKDITGTSAPEADLIEEKLSPRAQKRRYSGSKLRRKPEEVGDSRGDLKYFEDADDVRYRDQAGVVAFSSPCKHLATSGKSDSGATVYEAPKLNHPKTEPASTLSIAAPDLEAELRRIPRPINPKEAQTQRDSRVEYFLLLEDLTAGMKRPCIMDLKMGTRQYGVDATPKKRESQRRKCAETTSRELGVRVCGLQTWDAKSQTYVFRDKYYGRDLKAGKDFQDTLTMFLYDGVDYSSVLRHIPTILQKINQLEAIIHRLRGYRFYAASLLMFYDAGTSSDGNETAAEDSTTDVATDTEETWDVRRRQKNKAEIDFKIADFANSVTVGDLATNKPCPPKHPDEPDRGFLRGLATLRKYFQRIQKDVRREMGLNPLRKHEDDQVVEDDHDEPSVSE